MKKLRLICFLLLLFVISFSACERDKTTRKIKLANETSKTKSSQQLTTTLHFEPKSQRSIAVMFFQNLTGEDELQWLQKGLTEMLIRALSQSRSLSVLSAERVFEILERIGKSSSLQNIDMEIAALVGKEARVETILLGQIAKGGMGLKINVQLLEPHGGNILKQETVEGHGLENIFNMVDELTQKIKSDLQLSFEKTETSQSIAKITTESLEAWQLYTNGVDFRNKLLVDEAILQFEKAIQLDSSFVSASLDLCTLYLNRDENKKVNLLLKRLLKLREEATPQEKYQIDLLKARFNNDALAYVSKLQEWVQEYPEDRDANYTLAGLQNQWNNYEEAIRYFENVVKIDPHFKLTYNRLGYLYAYTGDFPRAISELEKYKNLAPDEPNPYDSLGEIYMLCGDYKKAEKYFKKAIQVNENFYASREHLANTFLEKGQYRKALQLYKDYLAHASNDFIEGNAYSMLARTSWRLGDIKSAIRYYQKALQKNNRNFVAIERLKDIYCENNDTTKAQEMLQSLYEQHKKAWQSNPLRFVSIHYLEALSFWWDVNEQETIELLLGIIQKSRKAKETIDKANLYNTKVALTLLYAKTNQEDKIKDIWQGQEIIPQEIWTVLKDVHDHSYSDDWRALAILNQSSYKYVDTAISFYQPLIQYAFENDIKAVEMMLRLLLADVYHHAQMVDEAEQQLHKAGVPREDDWLVIGPFDNKDGFRKKFPPEKRVQLDKIYKEKSWHVSWRQANDGIFDGFINLREIYERYNWSVAYGLLYVNSPDEKQVQLRFGTDDGSKLWLNGEEIWKFNKGGPAVFDEYKRNVTLQKGLNTILIKVCNTVSDWGFFFRVTDKKGDGVPDIEFLSAREMIS